MVTQAVTCRGHAAANLHRTTGIHCKRRVGLLLQLGCHLVNGGCEGRGVTHKGPVGEGLAYNPAVQDDILREIGATAVMDDAAPQGLDQPTEGPSRQNPRASTRAPS